MRAGLAGDAVAILVILGMIGAVSLLPPDTSLAEMRSAGMMRVCLPPSYPPLVTGDLERPGIDVELLAAVAAELGLRLDLNVNNAIGRDFNPRSWRVTRAQCQIIAGGVVASDTTRSFIDTTPSYAETGWAALSLGPLDDLSGKRIGVLNGVSGLDRLGLSGHLRRVGATVTVIAGGVAEAVSGLAEERYDAVVTEELLGRSIAANAGLNVARLPDALGRYSVVFGLWKGDLTLKRSVSAALEELRRNGTIGRILAAYLGAPELDPATVQRGAAF